MGVYVARAYASKPLPTRRPDECDESFDAFSRRESPFCSRVDAQMAISTPIINVQIVNKSASRTSLMRSPKHGRPKLKLTKQKAMKLVTMDEVIEGKTGSMG